MPNALVVERISKRFAGHTAVHDLSLVVPRGAIWGILGPNGAGKSTTLRMVMNIIARDSGRVLVDGADPESDRSVLRRIGYLPEERGLYRKMKVLDVIEFFSGLKGVPRSTSRARGVEWLERMGLTEWRDARVDTLSKGMQQKVQFIATVLHEPEILILDEPFSGLDPVNQEVLRDTVRNAHLAGRTVILSTHNMEQAQELCEGITIIAAGQKVVDGRLDEVRRAYRGNRYRVEFDERTPEAEEFIHRSTQFLVARAVRDGWDVELAPGVTGSQLLAALGQTGLAVRKFEHLEPTLHEIFVTEVGALATRPGRRVEMANA